MIMVKLAIDINCHCSILIDFSTSSVASLKLNVVLKYTSSDRSMWEHCLYAQGLDWFECLIMKYDLPQIVITVKLHDGT